MEILTNSTKPRVMVDTTVLLAGTVWPRWPYEVLQHAIRGDFQLVLSQIVIQEAARKFGEKFPTYTQDFKNFLAECDYTEIPAPPSREVLANRDLIRDVKDVPIAIAAINAGVDCFVSEDKDFTSHDQANTKLHEKLTVMLSGTFLRQVMGWASDELEAIRNRTWADFEEG